MTAKKKKAGPAKTKKSTAQKALAKYQAKRDFTVTAEPSGRRSGVKSASRLRYVIQKHAATRLHYDFRLEWNGTFRSWAVTRGPSLDPADKRLAVEVEDHPLDYGDFEGTIPKGQYGGGTVLLWDRGYWEPEGDLSPEDALANGDLKFTLDGEKLNGSWVLVRMKHDRTGGKRTNWLLIKHQDSYAREGDADALLAADKSVASGRTMATIAAGKGRAPKPFMLGNTEAPPPDAEASCASSWRQRREAVSPGPIQANWTRTAPSMAQVASFNPPLAIAVSSAAASGRAHRATRRR